MDAGRERPAQLPAGPPHFPQAPFLALLPTPITWESSFGAGSEGVGGSLSCLRGQPWHWGQECKATSMKGPHLAVLEDDSP